ncbi:hypothetical protein [Sphingomonas sp. BK235]|uniref:hypothetical protein n=1 Tax=Sphingomonas sp. BK235 TaxID=2512131 RepID=UPI0010510F10|nr:hypothetical protein [Sphingomonas sp. BK235]TCP33285.1 hypothetical protein EV292_106227 [Sphingomonas sp. BK235]
MKAAALLELLRRLAPLLTIAGLAAAALYLRAELVDARHDLALERSQATAAAERARRERAEIVAASAQREAKATSTFADRLAAREPLIVHSTDTVREYAQTDAGRALCLGADRVRAIDALDAARPGAGAAAGRGDGALHPVAGSPPTGR